MKQKVSNKASEIYDDFYFHGILYTYLAYKILDCKAYKFF